MSARRKRRTTAVARTSRHASNVVRPRLAPVATARPRTG
jgi:hypothetical protein